MIGELVPGNRMFVTLPVPKAVLLPTPIAVAVPPPELLTPRTVPPVYVLFPLRTSPLFAVGTVKMSFVGTVP